MGYYNTFMILLGSEALRDLKNSHLFLMGLFCSQKWSDNNKFIWPSLDVIDTLLQIKSLKNVR